ncbi:MAG: hypothetical protein KC592_08665, partial [Nitrospira sp.]|nr:hypothetical protein [Nitrospira sp.]
MMRSSPRFTWNTTDDCLKRGQAQRAHPGGPIPTPAFNDEDPVRGRSLSFSPTALRGLSCYGGLRPGHGRLAGKQFFS